MRVIHQKQDRVRGYPARAWGIYGLLAFVYFLANFHRLSTGVMKDELTDAFKLSSAAFANLGSMIFYAYTVMQIPAGLLVDFFGSRRTVTVGCIVTGIGSVLFASAQNIYTANFSRLLAGLGISVSYLCLLKIQAKWFDAGTFATVTGLTFLIGNLGSILAQTPLRLMVERLSWRGTFILFGAVSFLTALLVILFVRDAPDNKGTAAKPAGPEAASAFKALGAVIKNVRCYPPVLVSCFLCATVTTLTGSFGVIYIRDVYGLTMMDASKYTMILTLGISSGAFITGLLSDRLGLRKIIMALQCGIVMLVWIYIILICKGRPAFPVIGILYFITGFMLTAYTLTFTVVKELCDPEYSGISTSLVGFIGFIGSAAGPVSVGSASDRYSSVYSGDELYSRAFRVLVLCNAAAFAAALCIKEKAKQTDKGTEG
jgi:sugar phosphate permease